MKFAALSLKQAVIAGVLVTGSVASLVLIAPNLFGGEDVGDTDVAGTQAVRPLELEPAPSPDADDETTNSAVTALPAASSSAQPDDGDAAALRGAGTGRAGGSKPPGGGTKPGTDSPRTFEIKGDVTGVLYPTVVNDLPVKIENPYSFPIEITTASVTVGTEGSCSPQHLWINGLQPSASGQISLPAGQQVPANGDVTYLVPAELKNSAGDECQNTVYSLTYAAKAGRA